MTNATQHISNTGLSQKEEDIISPAEDLTISKKTGSRRMMNIACGAF